MFHVLHKQRGQCDWGGVWGRGVWTWERPPDPGWTLAFTPRASLGSQAPWGLEGSAEPRE